MKCDVCTRHEATAMITMSVNGKNTVRRVCQHCVSRLQRGDAYAAQMAVLSTMEQPAQVKNCPVCGRSAADVMRSGFVGCAACYHAFEEMLQPLVIRMNGAMQHPEHQEEPAASPRDEKNRQLAKLREEMFAAVNAEEYERAAQLRDEIRALEEEGGDA